MDLAEVLAKRIDDLNQNIRSLVGIYMQWYTFYWTLNSAALAWFWPKAQAGTAALPPNLVLWLFAVMSLPAGASSFFVLAAVFDMRRQVETLNDRLVSLLHTASPVPQVGQLTPATWPRTVTQWGLSVNGITTLCLGIVWLVLAVRCPCPAPASSCRSAHSHGHETTAPETSSPGPCLRH